MSSNPRFFAGVDGGGSSTRVLIAAEDGSVCTLGLAGPCNPHQVGVAGVSAALKTAFADAWARARRPAEPLDAVFLGIAGFHALGNPNLARETLAARGALAPGARVEADHDLRNALAGGLSGQPGIVIVAGTGSCAFARNAAGDSALCGGWGPLLDDAGSGYGIGLQGMRAAVRALDGRDDASGLGRELLRFLNVTEPRAVVAISQRMSRPEVAGFAPKVLQLAQTGDPAALRVVDAGAAELARMAVVLSQRLFARSAVPVVFAGGLSENAHYRSSLTGALSIHEPLLQLQAADHSPVAGALLLAFGLQQQTAPAELLARADALARSGTALP